MEPLVLGDIQALPRVPLQDLCSTTIAPQSTDYERAVETLAVSIAKYHCAMLQVPHDLLVSDSELWQVLRANSSQRPALLASVQGGSNNLVSLTYDPKLRRDSLCARLGGAHVLEDGPASYCEVLHLVYIQSRCNSPSPRRCFAAGTTSPARSCARSADPASYAFDPTPFLPCSTTSPLPRTPSRHRASRSRATPCPAPSPTPPLPLIAMQ